MDNIPEITGSPQAGVLSAFGMEAQVVDLSAEGTPELGVDLLIQPVGGLEVQKLATLPKGSMIMLIDPRVAAHLRAQVRSTQRKPGT